MQKMLTPDKARERRIARKKATQSKNQKEASSRPTHLDFNRYILPDFVAISLLHHGTLVLRRRTKLVIPSTEAQSAIEDGSGMA